MGDDNLNATMRAAANLVKMLTGHVVTLAVLTVSGFVIARVLGAESYGRYGAVMAVVAILQTASTFGLQQVEMRYLAPIWRAGEKSSAVALASSVWTARLGLSVAAGAIIAVWLGFSPRLQLDLGLCVLLGLLGFLRCAYEATRSLFLPVAHVGRLMAFDFVRATLTLPIVVFCFTTFGLDGVFAALMGLYAVLLASVWFAVLRIMPLRLCARPWMLLHPYIGYSTAAFVGMLAAMVQAQFGVYVLGSWVAPREAGFLALTIHLFNLTRGLFLASRRSLMPILAELEELGESRRVRYWGGVMMRYGAAAACIGSVAWALIGEDLVRLLLTETWAPVYLTTTVILLGVMFFCCAVSCNGLLYIRKQPRIAAVNQCIYAAATIVGIVVALQGRNLGASYRVCWIYVLASALFWVCSYTSLGVWGKLWLPLRRTLLLILPAILVWPVSMWSAPLALRWAALVGFLVLYLQLAILLKLLPVGEIREIWRILRGRSSGSRRFP